MVNTPLQSRRVAWINTKRAGVKSGRSSALKPDKLSFNSEASKRSYTGIGDLGVLSIFMYRRLPGMWQMVWYARTPTDLQNGPTHDGVVSARPLRLLD